jgi:hypothetical protein
MLMKKVLLLLLAAAVVAGAVPSTRDEIQWRWARYQDNTKAYEAYVKAWGQGRHAAAAVTLHDERGWADAVAANTIGAFEGYLTIHGDGGHVAEATESIQALRANDGVYSAALAGGEDGLRRFLTDFQGHRRERDARQALEDITEGRDIVDLLDEKKIEVQAQGSGIESVQVRVRRLVPYPLTVRIPAGTYFVAARQSAQNMVTTAASRATLVTDDWQSVSVPAACANRPRDIPGIGDEFKVQRSPYQKELARLMPVLERAAVPSDVRQAAVWIVTDNADFGDLGILVGGFGGFGPRVIDEQDAARAMMICDQAGIDIRRKAIWRDRALILKSLRDGDVRTWLQQKA